MKIFTIGYEGMDIREFISRLAEHDIETVVDVRELPLSRKPGFSKTALSKALLAAGLEYVHIVELGCPKPVRNSYRTDGDWPRYVKGFGKHLKEQEGAIATLAELSTSSRCVLLCYEADFNFCHRSMVADALREHCGATIEHIAAANVRTSSAAHPHAAFA